MTTEREALETLYALAVRNSKATATVRDTKRYDEQYRTRMAGASNAYHLMSCLIKDYIEDEPADDQAAPLTSDETRG